jgi:hypothetical protein
MILRAEHFVSGTTRLEGAGRQSENLQAFANSDCPESEFRVEVASRQCFCYTIQSATPCHTRPEVAYGSHF